MFDNIPVHLQAKCTSRSLKLHQMTKAEKIEAQLWMAVMRFSRQLSQQEQLKKQLEVVNNKHDD